MDCTSPLKPELIALSWTQASHPSSPCSFSSSPRNLDPRRQAALKYHPASNATATLSLLGTRISASPLPTQTGANLPTPTPLHRSPIALILFHHLHNPLCLSYALDTDVLYLRPPLRLSRSTNFTTPHALHHASHRNPRARPFSDLVEGVQEKETGALPSSIFVHYHRSVRLSVSPFSPRDATRSHASRLSQRHGSYTFATGAVLRTRSARFVHGAFPRATWPRRSRSPLSADVSARLCSSPTRRRCSLLKSSAPQIQRPP